jgi:hypothetical protein
MASMLSSLALIWRWTSLTMLVALVPLELGGLAASETVIELASGDTPDEISGTYVESSWPIGIDLLEIEDDEGLSKVGAEATTDVIEARDDGFEIPLVIHLDDFDRPPRA